MIDTENTTNEKQASEPECPVVREHGKHVMIGSEHRAGYKFWVPQCTYCGWVDTEKIEKKVLSQHLQTIAQEVGKVYPPKLLNRSESMNEFRKGMDAALSIINRHIKELGE